MRAKGTEQEVTARHYLVRQGLSLIKQNFTSRFGEIDLIMEDGGTLCFIEVKYRASANYGGAAASITIGKQKKIVKTAEYFLICFPRYQKHPMRFDSVLLTAAGKDTQINWIKGAFYAG